MIRYVRAFALVGVLAIAAVACSGGNSNPSGPSNATGAPAGSPVPGGTLLVESNANIATSGFDYQSEYWQLSFQIYRCCLSRTLMGYNGLPADQGGTKVYPDLADGEPQVSSDNMTWTFKIKPGIHYAPPLQDVEVTAADFVRSINREASPNIAAGYSFYYTDIKGFSDVQSGKAKTVSGVTALDKDTLQIQLTQPAGDLPYRMALAAMSPLPPNPSDPKAPFGIAEGHNDDFGRYFVGTGPYMIEGQDQLDFSLPASKQQPISGYDPGKHLSLVRNPSWVASTDTLRPAYLDGIDITMSLGAEAAVLEKKVQNDEIDTIMENGVVPQTQRTFEQSPDLQDQIFTNPAPSNYYIFMNLATPPFDDLHLRKAVQYAIDKDGWRKLAGGPITGEIANHFVPDVDENNLLKDYAPYATPNGQGDDTAQGLALAKGEMKQSKYDTNHDGICDAAACNNVLTVGVVGNVSESQDALIVQNLKKIGINLDLKSLENAAAYGKVLDPSAQIPMATFVGWIHDYPDGYTWFYPIMYGPSILSQYNTNYSMVGATSAQLKKYGYKITSVPSMDPQIKKCFPLSGDARTQCWADADKYMMENIAPVVPLVFSNVTNIVSSRVRGYVYSAVDQGPSWEHMWLAGGGSSSS
jgi:peptide/nickel transport system substrate-binding protein